MKTLKERITECLAKAAKIMEADPEIERLTFGLNDCDIDQIKELDVKPCVVGDRLMGVTTVTGRVTICAYTKPFKSVKPIEYEF